MSTGYSDCHGCLGLVQRWSSICLCGSAGNILIRFCMGACLLRRIAQQVLRPKSICFVLFGGAGSAVIETVLPASSNKPPRGRRRLVSVCVVGPAWLLANFHRFLKACCCRAVLFRTVVIHFSLSTQVLYAEAHSSNESAYVPSSPKW